MDESFAASSPARADRRSRVRAVRRFGVAVPLLDLVTLHLRVYQGRLEKDSAEVVGGSIP
jgi:hypothetical protein